MATREVTLKRSIQKAQSIEDDPNEGSRLQKQIDLLVAYVTAKPKPRRKS